MLSQGKDNEINHSVRIYQILPVSRFSPVVWPCQNKAITLYPQLHLDVNKKREDHSCFLLDRTLANLLPFHFSFVGYLLMRYSGGLAPLRCPAECHLFTRPASENENLACRILLARGNNANWFPLHMGDGCKRKTGRIKPGILKKMRMVTCIYCEGWFHSSFRCWRPLAPRTFQNRRSPCLGWMVSCLFSMKEAMTKKRKNTDTTKTKTLQQSHDTKRCKIRKTILSLKLRQHSSLGVFYYYFFFIYYFFCLFVCFLRYQTRNLFACTTFICYGGQKISAWGFFFCLYQVLLAFVQLKTCNLPDKRYFLSGPYNSNTFSQKSENGRFVCHALSSCANRRNSSVFSFVWSCKNRLFSWTWWTIDTVEFVKGNEKPVHDWRSELRCEQCIL